MAPATLCRTTRELCVGAVYYELDSQIFSEIFSFRFSSKKKPIFNQLTHTKLPSTVKKGWRRMAGRASGRAASACS